MQQIQMNRVDAFNHNYETEANTIGATQKIQFLHQPLQASLLYAATSVNLPATSYLVRNEFDKTMAQVVTAHGGLVLEVRQNLITALFVQNGQNAPAYQAVSSGLALIDQLMAANEYRLASGQTAIRLGIGISTGLVSLQRDGETFQLASGSGSDVMEAARQLSNLNQQTPFPAVFISQETYAILTAYEWHIENMGPVWLPDQATTKTIHAVMRPVLLQ